MRKNLPKSYDYIQKLAPAENTLMMEARMHSETLGLQSISISATEAQIIKFYLGTIKPHKVIEIGTLTGLSALHILEVLPSDGKLFTIEKSPEHAGLAGKVLAHDIKNGRCHLMVGDAREKLIELNSEGPFDAVFIDGNKSAYLDYFNWALENTRVNGLIFVDNIFLAGAVWGQATTQKFSEKQILAVQQMNQMAFSNRNLNSVIIPTEEGLLISQKTS